MMQLKQCSKCGEWKTLSEFYRHNQTKDKLRSDCKSCKREQDRQYYHDNREELLVKMQTYRDTHREESKERDHRYYWDNRDKRLASAKQYYQEHREERIEYAHTYYRENHDRVLAKQRLYSQKHKEEILARVKRWRTENPERRRESSRRYAQRRRACKAKLIADLSPDEWQWILAFWEYRCAYCGAHGDELEEPLQQEHVIPVCQGGGYTLGNIVPSCSSCNYRKVGKTPDEAGMTFFSESTWEKQGLLVELRGDVRPAVAAC